MSKIHQRNSARAFSAYGAGGGLEGPGGAADAVAVVSVVRGQAGRAGGQGGGDGQGTARRGRLGDTLLGAAAAAAVDVDVVVVVVVAVSVLQLERKIFLNKVNKHHHLCYERSTAACPTSVPTTTAGSSFSVR